MGAKKATWYPEANTTRQAKAATTVLPEPTSPCSSRAMGVGFCRSATISATARFCAAVRGKGSMARAQARSRSLTLQTGAGIRSRAARVFSKTRAKPANSSRAKRR
ncbi:hypothetical protein HRbin09_01422 [bacterium HR09]|nr:hypothetical protein HRbin09_01422 [bacterium HR09]